MKRITVTVEDDVAKTILSLLIDEAISFGVEDYSPLPQPGTRNRIRRRVGNTGPSGIVSELILTMPQPFTMDQLAEAVRQAGYKANSASPGVSTAIKAGWLNREFIDNGFRFTLNEAGKRFRDQHAKKKE